MISRKRKVQKDTYLKTEKGRACQKLNYIQKRAAKKGLACDLDTAWILDNLSKGCALTGLPFVRLKGGKGPNRFSPSIDRINNKIGYTKDNCRMILFALNALKHDGTDEEMYDLARLLIKKL